MGRIFFFFSLLIACVVHHFRVVGQPRAHPDNGFKENKGQWAFPYKYRYRQGSFFVFLEERGWFYYLTPPPPPHDHVGESADAHGSSSGRLEGSQPVHGIRLSFVSAGSPTLSANRPYKAYYNYFLGNDSSRWASRVRSFRSVWYCDMYDAVDVELRPRPGGLKYNIVVHPGGDLAAVGMHIEGANGVYLLRDKLYIETAYGNMVEQIPLAYQVIGGERRPLSCSYYLKDDNTVGFRVSGYDPTQALVIDPELIGSSLSGASADNRGYSACPDPVGQHLPFRGDLRRECRGGWKAQPACDTTPLRKFQVFGLFQYGYDVCIAKFNVDLSELFFFTYLGGAFGGGQ